MLRIFGISFLFLCDISLTYFYVVRYRKKYPKDKNWFELEMNPVLKTCWKKYGVNKGTFISAIVVYPVIFLIGLLLVDRLILGILIGSYWFVFSTHFHNIKDLLKKNYEGLGKTLRKQDGKL